MEQFTWKELQIENDRSVSVSASRISRQVNFFYKYDKNLASEVENIYLDVPLLGILGRLLRGKSR